MASSPRILLAGALVAAGLLYPAAASAQDLGHKFPGGIGVDAGVQHASGLYLVDRLVYYSASRLRDRNGQVVAVPGFALDVVANAVGVSGTLQWRTGLYLTATIAAPLAHLSVNTDEPLANVDRFGLGDVYVMPLQLGLRLSRFDVVASYGIYIPTGHFELHGSKGVSSGQWSNQFSLGGAVFFDSNRRGRASALVSYDLNFRKRNIDITRGDTVQIQGGAGVLLWKVLDIGVAGYALWQVRDDRGTALPDALQGARDRVFGFGPELNVQIPQLRTKVGARYEWDIGARARPQGGVLAVTVSVLAWKPK
ncbi:transporter [Myxococcaceae bacterium GXIMD 01537]